MFRNPRNTIMALRLVSRTKWPISIVKIGLPFVTRHKDSLSKLDITWVHEFTRKCPNLCNSSLNTIHPQHATSVVYILTLALYALHSRPLFIKRIDDSSIVIKNVQDLRYLNMIINQWINQSLKTTTESFTTHQFDLTLVRSNSIHFHGLPDR